MHPRILVLFFVVAAYGLCSNGRSIGFLRWHLAGAPSVAMESKGHRSVLQFSTKPFTLDKLYMSMTGPSSLQHNLRLLPFPTNSTHELLWLTGVHSEVVDANSAQPISQEFFCHANLTFDSLQTTPQAHNAAIRTAIGGSAQMDWRLFTLVPGKMDIQLPAGFGIPIYSDTPLDFFSMSLNQNVSDRTVRVRFNNQLEFLRNSELAAPMHAVYRRALYVLEPLTPEGLAQLGHHSEANHSALHPGEGCGEPNVGRTATDAGILEQFGNDVTIHWLVPPGVHLYKTDVTAQLNLSSASKIHYAAGHLHPFANYIALVDKTAGQTIIKLSSHDYKDRLGIEAMDDLSSPEGLSIYPDHQYELHAEYSNPLKKETDAMAILYLYIGEPHFSVPLSVSER